MRDPTVIALDDSEWDVPTHKVALYGEKRHAHALIIPVINEDERIRGQLLRVQAARLPVDVIVADGGSTDGSLHADFVEPAGVRCVLTKTGPGKLSAQLRMAYAWALREGYEGVVTIDGNGKDGVEAVATMVERLEAGCDYVQGSRYLPGGEAENTPLERTIANRLIHAPLLSVAGRHWFLDTTNGFRAYSARYLTHPEVQPFREEFQVYNLLFYLTVRAGQLGLKVDHCPVIRRYPESGKVPTKIGGLASKLALLGETVRAATGGYTPSTEERGPALLGWPLLAAVLVCLPFLISSLISPAYSPDSWAFYELSQTIFGDFYRATHVRSYANDIPYSAAFPPLWPTLIAVADAAFDTGARTGLYLAFASFVGFSLLSEVIGRRVTGAAWFGLAVALALLLGPKMITDELAAGRTLPFQLVLNAVVLLGLLKGRAMSLPAAIGVGLAAGLAVLNRFDALPLPFLAAGLVLWLSRKPSYALASLGAALIAVSPWIAYSLGTFGTVFATDNAGIATSLDPNAFVTDWWPIERPGLADDPAAWIAKVLGALPRFLYIAGAVALSPLGLAAAMTLAGLGAFVYLTAQAPKTKSLPPHQQPAVQASLGFAAICALLLTPQLFTGYIEYRYFTALAWAAAMAAGGWLIATGVTPAQRRVYARLAALALSVWIVPFAAMTAINVAQATPAPWEEFEQPADVTTLGQCLQDTPEARTLVIGDNLFAARAGALGGIAAMMEPRNMAEGRLSDDGIRAFLKAQRVDYVLVMDPARTAFAAETLKLERDPGCALPLYRSVP
ncbi:MAG: glycosyltransferase family 2 protein [Pseudomonadota bacterium]